MVNFYPPLLSPTTHQRLIHHPQPIPPLCSQGSTSVALSKAQLMGRVLLAVLFWEVCGQLLYKNDVSSLAAKLAFWLFDESLSLAFWCLVFGVLVLGGVYWYIICEFSEFLLFSLAPKSPPVLPQFLLGPPPVQISYIHMLSKKLQHVFNTMCN